MTPWVCKFQWYDAIKGMDIWGKKSMETRGALMEIEGDVEEKLKPKD